MIPVEEPYDAAANTWLAQQVWGSPLISQYPHLSDVPENTWVYVRAMRAEPISAVTQLGKGPPHVNSEEEPPSRELTHRPVAEGRPIGIAEGKFIPNPPGYSPYLHARLRYPAASGFTEDQLDGVPLVTVYPAAAPAIMGAVFCLLALLGGPYELYVVIRWAVPAAAIWASIVAGSLGRTPWVIAFVTIAVLFNPLIPIEATQAFWTPIDSAGLLLFCTAGVKFRTSKPAPPRRSARY
jgi:hypothetical protein